jgi:hypothetical protein
MAMKDRFGEGFGMPLGVAKPPMQEPAVRMRWAMGFSDLAWSSAGRERRHMPWRACQVDVVRAAFEPQRRRC